MKVKRKTKRTKDKGKAFRSSLHTSMMGDDLSGTSEPSWTDSMTTEEKNISRASEMDEHTGQTKTSEKQDFECLAGIQFIGMVEGRQSSVEVINVDDVPPKKEVSLAAGETSADLLHRDDNFRYPRRILGETALPEVDDTLRTYKKGNSSDCTLTDPLEVDKLLPLSIIDEIEEEFRKKSNLVVKFPLYGNFDREGVQILNQFHQ